MTNRSDSTDLRKALDALAINLDAVGLLVQSPHHRDALESMRHAYDRLCEPAASGLHDASGLHEFDEQRFQRLMEIAGPELGPELLSRLFEDLTDVRKTLDASVPDPDWQALRGASHVLISLAGSVGAVSLQKFADRLNVAANAADDGDLTGLLDRTSAETRALIAFVGSRAAQTEAMP